MREQTLKIIGAEAARAFVALGVPDPDEIPERQASQQSLDESVALASREPMEADARRLADQARVDLIDDANRAADAVLTDLLNDTTLASERIIKEGATREEPRP